MNPLWWWWIVVTLGWKIKIDKDIGYEFIAAYIIPHGSFEKPVFDLFLKNR